VIEFGAGQPAAACILKRSNLESTRSCCAGTIAGGKDRFTIEQETQLPREGQSVVTYSIERPWRPRHNLKQGFQAKNRQ
jgi:hypothetical protein